jgi:hypothetical protein
MMRWSTCWFPSSRVSPCHIPSGFTRVLSEAALSLQHTRLAACRRQPRTLRASACFSSRRERATLHWEPLAFDHVSQTPHTSFHNPSSSRLGATPRLPQLTSCSSDRFKLGQPCARRARQPSGIASYLRRFEFSLHSLVASPSILFATATRRLATRREVGGRAARTCRAGRSPRGPSWCPGASGSTGKGTSSPASPSAPCPPRSCTPPPYARGCPRST